MILRYRRKQLEDTTGQATDRRVERLDKDDDRLETKIWGGVYNGGRACTGGCWSVEK